MGRILGGVLLVLVWLPVAVLAVVFAVLLVSDPEEYWLELGFFGVLMLAVLAALAIGMPVGAALLFGRAGRSRREAERGL